MSTETNKAVVRRWVEEGWNKGNLGVVDEIYAANVLQHDPGSPFPVNSAEALKMYVDMYKTAFPDLTLTIEDLVAEGDKVLWRFNSHGTHTGALGPLPPTHKEGNVTGMVLFRCANDKIAEVWVNIDALGLFQQLGVIPKMG